MKFFSAATLVLALAALALAVVGVVRGTWAAGGSDSSCYALMAEAFATGAVQPVSPLASEAPWPDAALTLAPAGFFPSPVRPAAASPVCAPGFSLLMAPFRRVLGPDGIFWVTPVAAVLLVWSAFIASRALAGPLAGAMTAILTAASPIVLFQVVQPMNDITTTALWMAAIAAATLDPRTRWWVMGMVTGVAVLVRPNLAPLAVVLTAWVGVSGKGARPLVVFAAAAAPGVLIAAWLNWMLYGHPLRLGYGNAADLFSASFITVNLAHYGRALVETQTPFPLLACAAPWVVPREHRSYVWLCLGVAVVTIAVYLPYRSFDEWWYVRFLLPAIVPMLALASAVAARLLGRPGAIAVAAILLAAFGIKAAVDRQAFDLQRLEARFRHSAEVVGDRLPPNAVLITVWQSGTVRYHANRESVLWDSMHPSALDGAVTWLAEHGREPFILLERWEEPLFRERFGGHATLGALDWPPRLEVDRLVRIYAPGDRQRYLAGEPVSTEHVIGRSRD